MKAIFILLALAAFFMASLTFYWARQRKITIRTFFLWMFVWLSMLIFSLFPDLLTVLLKVVRMEIRAYFFFLSGILFLFLLQFLRALSDKRNERALHALVQEVALLKFKIEQLEEQKNA